MQGELSEKFQDVETAYRSCTTFVRENNEAIEEVEDHEGKPGKEPHHETELSKAPRGWDFGGQLAEIRSWSFGIDLLENYWELRMGPELCSFIVFFVDSVC